MNSTRNELKSLFTGYWLYLAVHTACKLNIFDQIQSGNNTVDKLILEISANKSALKALLSALVIHNYLTLHSGLYMLNEKSELLTDDHPLSLKNACILWGMEHMDAWQNLDSAIRTGKSAVGAERQNYFEFLTKHPYQLKNYHKAMNEYAIDDYRNICEAVDFSKYSSIMDVGGGLGALLQNIKRKFPSKKYYLFDKPEVIVFVKDEKFEKIGGDFFYEIPKVADCIILSRVIHDWETGKANAILKNCYDALPENGTIILIENFSDEIENNAALLSLNMLVICESMERSRSEYRSLLKKLNFSIKEIKKLNDLQHIIIAEK